MTNTEITAVDNYIASQIDFLQAVMDRFGCDPQQALELIIATTTPTK